MRGNWKNFGALPSDDLPVRMGCIPQLAFHIVFKRFHETR